MRYNAAVPELLPSLNTGVCHLHLPSWKHSWWMLDRKHIPAICVMLLTGLDLSLLPHSLVTRKGSLKKKTLQMGKFSSFLIYSRKNIKHSENIFHILRAIQNILHGSSSWVLQQIHWFSDAFTCSYKNKTYKRDIYTSLTCKSWGTPLPSGRQLLCGTAMKRATMEGVHVIFFISFTQYGLFLTGDVTQRSNSSFLGDRKGC